MNSEGQISGWNPQAATMFGWTSSQAIGSRLAELIVPPQHRAAHEVG